MHVMAMGVVFAPLLVSLQGTEENLPPVQQPQHATHSMAVQPGLGGACLGGGLGICLGFGLPGMCLGGLAGSYVEDTVRDGLEDPGDESQRQMDEQERLHCEQMKELTPPNTPYSQVECGVRKGHHAVKELAMGVGGAAFGIALAASSMVSTGLLTVAGLFFAWRLGPQGVGLVALGAGTLGSASVLLAGITLANIIAVAASVPLAVNLVTSRISIE